MKKVRFDAATTLMFTHDDTKFYQVSLCNKEDGFRYVVVQSTSLDANKHPMLSRFASEQLGKSEPSTGSNIVLAMEILIKDRFKINYYDMILRLEKFTDEFSNIDYITRVNYINSADYVLDTNMDEHGMVGIHSQISSPE